MTWADWVTIPPLTVILIWWLLSLATQHFFRAWVLTYVAQGILVTGAVLYLFPVTPSELVPIGILYASLWGERRIFHADGPCSWLRVES